MRRVSLAALFLTVGALGLWAQDDNPPNPAQPVATEDQAPPERSVARISLINGDVSVRRGDSGDVVAAALNAPLVLEDRLLTASSSRAEVQFDSTNMLRIASNSEVRMGDLQYKHFQAQVAIGTVTFRVLRNTDGQMELDTPILGIHPLRPGVYRVTVREDGSTDITVREGEAEILTRRGNERLQAGNTMLARGTEADPEFQIVAEYGPDEFDRWNATRDQTFLRSQSYQHVSPDIYGTEDLDNHGRWVNDSTYGQVWAPTVDPGWAPYQDGRWVWEDWYGWTWVSNDPWGWAPYHYGRWFYGSCGWSWYPGPGRHYWSPALVGFFGYGGGVGVGVGFGFGNVGWVALAPHERFSPWWGRGFYGNSHSIGSNSRLVNNVNVTSVYRNARVANGVSSVTASNFGRGGGRFSSVNGATIQNAGMVRGALPVTPNRSSLNYSDRQARTTGFAQSRASGFFGRNPSAQSQRVPFEQQRQAMDQVARGQASGGSSNSGGWRRQDSTGQGGAASTGNNGHGWQRFGEPVHGAQSPRGTGGNNTGSSSGGQSNTGWRSSGSSSQTAPSLGGSRGYQSAPPQGRTEQNSPRSFGGSSGSSGGRISQPMVHERAPSSGSSNSGGRGSGASSSPRGNGGGSGGSGGNSGGHRGGREISDCSSLRPGQFSAGPSFLKRDVLRQRRPPWSTSLRPPAAVQAAVQAAEVAAYPTSLSPGS